MLKQLYPNISQQLNLINYIKLKDRAHEIVFIGENH